MKITAYRTPLVTAGDNLEEILAASIPSIPERSVIVVASKIISTAENRFLPKTSTERAEKHALVRQEADRYLEPSLSKYGVMLTVKGNWIFANAGIDESNADDHYLLWPADPQAAANQLWHFFRRQYNLQEVGVTISDSSSQPLNWGVVGHSIAACGFEQLRSYIWPADADGTS
jgi:F420-0:gamma-glutamyl ligase